MADTEDLGNLNTKNWNDLQKLADSLEASWQKGQAVDLVARMDPFKTLATLTALATCPLSFCVSGPSFHRSLSGTRK